MNLNLDQQQADLQKAFADMFAREVPASRVRSSEPLGFDRALWDTVAAAGVTAMGVPEDAGGEGGSLCDLALVAELAGQHLAPVPLVEAAVAARLLARYPACPDELRRAVLAGQHIAAVALRPARDRTCRLVPGGAVAASLIALDGDDLVLAALDGSQRHRQNLGSAPLADCPSRQVIAVLDHGERARAAIAVAADEWRVLTAAALVGVAAAAHEMARAHVLRRRIFGNVLGAFQSVAHRLADDIVSIDGARFLALEAAWMADQDLATAGFASAAFAYASDTAQRVTADCLHLHGGLGYTLEHDAQLYFRRAKAWPLVLADPAHEYLRVADALWPAGTA